MMTFSQKWLVVSENVMKKHLYKYDLIFAGKIRNGFTHEQITQTLRDEVKLDKEQIADLFLGQVRICKGADYATALQVHKKFYALGLELKLQLASRPVVKEKTSRFSAMPS